MSEQTFDQPLPQAPDAERAVLGSVLINNKAFFRVCTIVKAGDFLKASHRSIFMAMDRLAHQREAIDSLTVKALLAHAGELEAAGGSSYISSLSDNIPDVANVERYARIVVEKSKLRQIIRACNTGERDAMDVGARSSKISTDLLTTLTAVSVPIAKESRPLHERMAQTNERADLRVKEGRPAAIEVGFDKLDSRAAIRPTLVIAGAPSGHGKSAFLLNLWMGMLKHSDAGSSAFYSLEMTDDEVTPRVQSILTGVPLKSIRAWRFLSDDDRAALNHASKWIAKQKHSMFFADRLRSVDEIHADVLKLQMLHGLKAIFIDYVQLLRGGRGRSPEEEMRRVAEDLLQMAIELKIAVVAASQVNKEREKRQSGRLSQQDLKYAAAIGDSARVVLLFQRPWYDDKENEKLREGQVNFQIEKNSEGTVGDFEMHFAGPTQRFTQGGCVEAKCRHCRGAGEKQSSGPRELFAEKGQG